MEYQDHIDFFSANRSKEDPQMDFHATLREQFSLEINDEFYFSFIEDINNGGFFFDQALQFYSFTAGKDFRNIAVVNETFFREYGELFNGLVTFAQDIFGNQFAFDTKQGCIVSFDIETAARTVVAESFMDWLIRLESDLNYVAGIGYANEWKKGNDLAWDQRILPEVPFVIGGEYRLENFDTSTFPYYISYNAQLAKQIYNLEDGEKVELVIKKKE